MVLKGLTLFSDRNSDYSNSELIDILPITEVLKGLKGRDGTEGAKKT